MNVQDIVIKYLDDNGYDGLFNGVAPCGCETKEICPWGEMSIDCIAAYKHSPADCKNCDNKCDGYDEDNGVCFTTIKPKDN